MLELTSGKSRLKSWLKAGFELRQKKSLDFSGNFLRNNYRSIILLILK
jgi:hypothetical protein